jgi:Uma2 family endonuclease
MSAKRMPISYPDDDGLPMSDNTWQFNGIVLLHSGLEAAFADRPDVFVAGNHLIYTEEGQVEVRQAPDVYVAFGRTKAHRGSYKVWEEGGVFPQVVFEVWSPNNRAGDMKKKHEFYEKYGAEEYYIVYPEHPSFVEGWRRENGKFVSVPEMNGFVSPRLGIRFELHLGRLTVFGPDGRPFRSPTEIMAERDEAERAAAEAERREAEATARAARLAAKLRELGGDPDAV